MEKRVFLASSNELENEKNKIDLDISRGVFDTDYIRFKTKRWEYMDKSISENSFQSEITTNGIKQSDIIIVILKNKIGKYTKEEFEAALVMGIKIFVFSLKSDNIDSSKDEFLFNLLNNEKYFIESNSIDHLIAEIARQFKIYSDELKSRPINIKKTTYTNNILEGFSYIDYEKVTLHDKILDKIDIFNTDNKINQPIPNHFLYNSDIGTLNWLSLSEYDVDNPISKPLRNNIKAELFDTLSSMKEADYISLGPGNGKKDTEILHYLLEKNTNLTYFPIDISQKMIDIAVYNLLNTQKLKRKISNSNFQINYVHSLFDNIENFSHLFNKRATPKVYSLLGNTLGNVSDEKNLLIKIRSCMNIDDKLLLEVRFINNINQELPGTELEGFEFNISPLKYLGANCEFKNYKFQLSQDGNYSNIRGTQTRISKYENLKLDDNTNTRDINLGIINYYDKNNLEAELEDLGFYHQLVDYSNMGLGLYILKLKQ